MEFLRKIRNKQKQHCATKKWRTRKNTAEVGKSERERTRAQKIVTNSPLKFE